MYRIRLFINFSWNRNEILFRITIHKTFQVTNSNMFYNRDVKKIYVSFFSYIACAPIRTHVDERKISF